MPFKERTRRFWKKVNNDKCAYVIYDEKDGFHECGRLSKHVHHIDTEGNQLERGDDPERSEGMPLCEPHHVRNLGDEEYSDEFAFHPDAGRAYKQYREWKQQAQHMEAITGKKSNVPSPFQEMSAEHGRKREAGERYHSGTDELDAYYKQEMTDKATRYLAEHPEEKKPDTVPHPRYDPKKKKNWYDGL